MEGRRRRVLRQIAIKRGEELSLILVSSVSTDGEEDGEGVRAVRRGGHLGRERNYYVFPENGDN